MAEKFKTLTQSISRATLRTDVRSSSGLNKSDRDTYAFGFIAGKRLQFSKTPSVVVFPLFFSDFSSSSNVFQVFKDKNRIRSISGNIHQFFRNLMVNVSLKKPDFSGKFFYVIF